MAFTKGNTHGKGRIKGSKNRNTVEIRQFFQDFVNRHLEELNEAFSELEAREKFKFIIEMTKFVIPSLRSVSGTIDDLTEEQFNELVTRVKKEYNL